MEKTIKFGVIGCGLMGREFASASMRWLHLQTDLPRPQIIAACSRTDKKPRLVPARARHAVFLP